MYRPLYTPIGNKLKVYPKNASSRLLTVTMDNTENLQKYIRAFQRFADDDSLKEMGAIARDTFNKYVPYRHGALRRSCKVLITNDTVSLNWGNGLPYAHYQYMGEIYDENHVYFRNGVSAGWYSSPTKKPSGRFFIPNRRYTLFDKNHKYICRLGYTTRNTTHHWIDEVLNDPQKYTPMKFQMTNYLYKKLQHNFGGTPVGESKS